MLDALARAGFSAHRRYPLDCRGCRMQIAARGHGGSRQVESCAPNGPLGNRLTTGVPRGQVGGSAEPARRASHKSANRFGGVGGAQVFRIARVAGAGPSDPCREEMTSEEMTS